MTASSVARFLLGDKASLFPIPLKFRPSSSSGEYRFCTKANPKFPTDFTFEQYFRTNYLPILSLVSGPVWLQSFFSIISQTLFAITGLSHEEYSCWRSTVVNGGLQCEFIGSAVNSFLLSLQGLFCRSCAVRFDGSWLMVEFCPRLPNIVIAVGSVNPGSNTIDSGWLMFEVAAVLLGTYSTEGGWPKVGVVTSIVWADGGWPTVADVVTPYIVWADGGWLTIAVVVTLVIVWSKGGWLTVVDVVAPNIVWADGGWLTVADVATPNIVWADGDWLTVADLVTPDIVWADGGWLTVADVVTQDIVWADGGWLTVADIVTSDTVWADGGWLVVNDVTLDIVWADGGWLVVDNVDTPDTVGADGGWLVVDDVVIPDIVGADGGWLVVDGVVTPDIVWADGVWLTFNVGTVMLGNVSTDGVWPTDDIGHWLLTGSSTFSDRPSKAIGSSFSSPRCWANITISSCSIGMALGVFGSPEIWTGVEFGKIAEVWGTIKSSIFLCNPSSIVSKLSTLLFNSTQFTQE